MDKPDLKKIGETMSNILDMMSMRCPFPEADYWRKFGVEPNPDGTVDTPGGLRIPTAELCEIADLEELYKL